MNSGLFEMLGEAFYTLKKKINLMREFLDIHAGDAAVATRIHLERALEEIERAEKDALNEEGQKGKPTPNKTRLR
jgi:hypothetical protein